MAGYEEWDPSFQDVWDSTPGTGDLESYEESHAEALFEVGFTHTSEEYEAMGYSEDDVAAIREEFFDYMGLEDWQFDWDGWREAMGYE
jgi:hypothetical protein